jgi:hypothetical protein
MLGIYMNICQDTTDLVKIVAGDISWPKKHFWATNQYFYIVNSDM